MHIGTSFFLVTTLMQVTLTTASWGDMSDEDKESFANLIFTSKVFESIVSQDLIYPTNGFFPVHGDKNTRLIVGYNREERSVVLYVFMVAVIHLHVVFGKMHKVEDAGNGPDAIGLLQQEAEARLESWPLKLKWAVGNGFFDFVEIENKNYTPEIYCTSPNGANLGIYGISTTKSFCFVKFFGKPSSSTIFTYMGSHHKNCVAAFNDLEQYAMKRKAVLLDPWIPKSDLEPESKAYERILKLGAHAANRLGLSESDLTLESAKFVTPDEVKILAVFSSNLETPQVLLGGVGSAADSSDITLTLIGQTPKDSDSIHNYFTFSFFSEELKHARWTYACEIFYLKNTATLEKLALTEEELTIMETKIHELLLGLSNRTKIYLQAIRLTGETQWLAIYGVVERLMWVTFDKIEKNSELILSKKGHLETTAGVAEFNNLI